MDQICSRIRNLTLIPIEDKNKYQQCSTKSTAAIICTPELHHYLAEITYKCAIIKTAYQFVALEDLISKDRDYENKIRMVIGYGNRILNCLECRLSMQDFLIQSESETLSRIPEQVEMLMQLNQQLEPLFNIAQKSINTTNDRLGITDRLFGYRNNLSRNGLCNYRQRHSFELHDSSRPEMAPRFNVPGWNTRTVESVKPNPTYHFGEQFKQWKANTAERAGLEPNYPGQSETRSAFTKPPRPVTDIIDNHGKIVTCRPGYRINPNPNLEDLGYKLIKPKSVEPIKSEYSISFQYPDAKLANPCPWKRVE